MATPIPPIAMYRVMLFFDEMAFASIIYLNFILRLFGMINIWKFNIK